MLRPVSAPTLAVLSLLVLGCEGAGDRPPGNDDAGDDGIFIPPDPVDPGPAADPGEYLKGIEGEFMAAAEEFDVPIDVLKAVGYVESQWQMVVGEVEFDGLEPAFGTMALRGEHLARAAELLGRSVEDVQGDRPTNIRGAAAWLSDRADAQGIDRADLGAWARAIADYSGIAAESPAAQSYVHQNVYSLISNGLVVTDLDGNVISEIQPKSGVLPDYPGGNGPVFAADPDYDGAIFRPSPNKGSRPAGSAGEIRMVIIHTCEGAYAGCWGWLVNPKSGVSAHYVVNADGSEVSQLVKESERGYHIGAKYKSGLNGGKYAELEGSSSNNFTVGIEHAGFGNQASWAQGLIDTSARLVCDITRRNGIPRDKFHIVGHGQLQPYNRTDPGPNWPWGTYFDKIAAACNDGGEPQEPPPEPPPNDPPPDPTGDPPPDPTGDPPPDDPPPDPTGDPPPDDPPPSDPTEIVVDSDNGLNSAIADFYAPASWTSTASTPGYYGSGYLYAATTNVDDGAEFWFYLNSAGTYNVDVWYTAGANRSDQAPIVAFDGNMKELGFESVNMQQGGKSWTPAGAYDFPAGWNMVMVSRWAPADRVVIADAVRLRR